MKRKQWLICAVCLCLLLTGCDLWMDGSYHNVVPHNLPNAVLDDTQTVCRTYMEVRSSLEDLVESGSTKGVIYMEGFTQEEMESYMEDAISHATKGNPIGAYAVEGIQYEIGTNAATPAVAVDITYLHNRSEILRIKQTADMEEAYDVITAALDSCSAGVVFYVEHYTATDIEQLVEDYVNQNPSVCMEMPQVTVLSYPERGIERVIELSFTYQTSRENLRSMQENVATVFASAELYVRGDAENREKYAQLYSFLMERYDYTIETSITPAYSLLRHGVGDSKAFAVVYAQMCRLAGLECMAVSGTREGQAWYWNIIEDDGSYYHVDLLECDKEGLFRTKTAEEMSGYVWDYSAYPSTEQGEEINEQDAVDTQTTDTQEQTEPTQAQTADPSEPEETEPVPSGPTLPEETVSETSAPTELTSDTVPTEPEGTTETTTAH